MSDALMKLGLLLIILASLTACQTTGSSAPIDSFCLVAKPITWSAKDTEQTRKEIRSHNAAWKALCAKK